MTNPAAHSTLAANGERRERALVLLDAIKITVTIAIARSDQEEVDALMTLIQSAAREAEGLLLS